MATWYQKILLVIVTTGFSNVFYMNDALGIPHFARKYDKRCSVCHAAVPKLNSLGERFRLNGYQFPGSIESTPVWYQNTPPISGMIHGMYMDMTMENNTPMPMQEIAPGDEVTIKDFEAQSLELFAGGTLGEHLSYFSFIEFEQEGEFEDGNWQTEMGIGFNQLFGMYNNLLGGDTGSMNFKFGLFEMELPFSSLRALGSPHSTPYLVYSVDPLGGGGHGGSSFRLDQPQTGIALNGILSSGFQYELGLVNGTNTEFDTNDEKDVYIRLAQHIGDQRIGAFYYRGKANLESTLHELNNDFSRAGLDFSFNMLLGSRHLNLYGQYMWGKNGNFAVSAAGHDEDEANDDDDAGDMGGMDGMDGMNGDGMDGIDGMDDDHLQANQKFEYSGYFLEADLSIIPHKLVTMYRYERLKVDKQSHLFTQDVVTRNVFQVRWYFTPNFFTVLQYHTQDNKLGNMTMADQAGFGTMDMDSKMFMAMLAYVL